MNTNKLILVFAVLAVLLSSCVSKKKFLDMESSKLRAEDRVRELTTENKAKADRIQQMIADFEKMKQELLASNAEKDQLIITLNGQINKLNSNVEEKDASFEEKIYAFEYEKRRINQELEDQQQELANLQSRNEDLSSTVNKLQGDLTEKNFDLNRQKEENSKLINQLSKGDQKYEEQAKQLAAIKAEVQRLKVEMQTKDETIERLKNNVSLLKKEIGS
ncbi:hypothetical protein ACUNWD_11410 [Sunxiuqinia sp. A32]|uniref:hypothetical protein n=1 Tax=Sunxiuqinia sp. A32 TaxID=3461496 RepID=UPI0040460336